MSLGRPLVDRRSVGDGGLSLAVAPSPTPLRLALREQSGKASAPAGRAGGMAVGGLRAEGVFRFFELHPPGDLLRRPSHGKAVLDVGAKAAAASDPRAAQLARPGTAIGAVGPVAVNTTVSPDLAMDGGAMSTKPTRDLAAAQPHLHQAAQAASLHKREVAVSRSHGDPGHSRCRTWFVDLRGAPGGDVPQKTATVNSAAWSR